MPERSPVLTLVHPDQYCAPPLRLLEVDGRDASHALTASGAGVSGGNLLLLEDGRSTDNPLVEGHHRLVESTHHHVGVPPSQRGSLRGLDRDQIKLVDPRKWPKWACFWPSDGQ